MTPSGLHPCHRIAFSGFDHPLRDPLLTNLLHHTLLEAVRGASDLRSNYRALAVLRVDFFLHWKRIPNSVCRLPVSPLARRPEKTLRLRAIRES